MASPETIEKLREQRGFLERSLADFLNGHEEEAVRIATSIRVLVHEGRGKPLLKSFKPNYLDLPILDSDVAHPPDGGRILARFAPVVISTRGVQPITDRNTKETIIGKWWTRPCVTATTPEGRTIDFTREEIILTLADKEGGAHVDEVLPEHYRSIPEQFHRLASLVVRGLSVHEIVENIAETLPSHSVNIYANTIIEWLARFGAELWGLG